MQETEIELVSSQRLRNLLSDEVDRRKELEALPTDEDGVLGRRVHDDTFVIVDKQAVKAAIAKPDESEMPDEGDVVHGEQNAGGELSLVSTVVLNRMLQKDKEPEAEDEPLSEELANFKHSGFDPYNSS